MVDAFIGILEHFLGIKRIEFSIAKRWEECPPAEATDKTLKQYLDKVRHSSSLWSIAHKAHRVPSGLCAATTTTHSMNLGPSTKNNTRKTLTKAQSSTTDGCVPSRACSSLLIVYRGVGKEVSSEEYNTHIEEQRVFREWFDQNVFSSDPETLSDAIMIMPYGSANPKYRDSPNEYIFSIISPLSKVNSLLGPLLLQARLAKNLSHRSCICRNWSYHVNSKSCHSV